MQKQTLNFLEAYRDLESEIEQSSVYEFEKTLDPESVDAKRLTVTRIIRNYIIHVDPEFIVPSKSLTDFVKKLTEKERNKKLKYKNVMKKINHVTLANKNIEIINMLKPSTPVIPIIDKGLFIGLFTKDVAIKIIQQDKQKNTVRNIKAMLELPKAYAKPDTLYNNFKDILIITEDGKKSGKYLGIVYPKK